VEIRKGVIPYKTKVKELLEKSLSLEDQVIEIKEQEQLTGDALGKLEDKLEELFNMSKLALPYYNRIDNLHSKYNLCSKECKEYNQIK
jgi:hypothetical protein